MTKNFGQEMDGESVGRNSDQLSENDYFEKEFEKCQICMILNLDDIFVAESKSDLKEHLFSEHGIVREKKTRQITKNEASEKSEIPSNFPKFESKMEVNLEESTICEICDTEFPTAIRLKKHISSVHEKAQITKNKIPGIPSNLWQPIFPKSGAKMEVDLDSSNDELEDDNLDANPSEFVDIKISDEKPEKTSYEVNNLQIIL